MERLEASLERHRKAVLACWFAAILVALPFAARENDKLTGSFAVPGAESTHVDGELEHHYRGVPVGTLSLLLVPRRDAGPAQLHAAVDATAARARKVSGVGISPAALAHAARGAAAGRPVLLQLDVAGGAQGRAIDTAKALRESLGISRDHAGRTAGGTVAVHLIGQGALWTAFQTASKSDAQTAEARAFPLIALILLAVFGSFATVALPLGLGFAAVLITAALIYALSLVAQMAVFVTNISSMIGIGVAVDYSLFVLTRYREEIAAGRAPREARAAAARTSGVAVAFSGLTVIASLAGLFLLNSPALRSMAAGAIVVVAISVVASATLLPVLIGLLGDRAHRPGRVARVAAAVGRRRRARPAETGFWERWAAAVMRRPVLYVGIATTTLLVMAAPALDLKTGNEALHQLSVNDEARVGAEAAATTFGPGALGPVNVVVRPGGSKSAEAALRVGRALARDPGIRRVAPPRAARGGHSVLLVAQLRTQPGALASRATVSRLRDELPAAAGREASVEIGGTTAATEDFDRRVWGSMWKLVLFVLALSFVVLVVLLRSLVLPLKAVVMNLLTVAAAYGALVVVFQWGWLGFLGLAKGPFIDTITPPLVLVVAFGLSMDYEVFLLSRIRERYARTGDNRRAVGEGLATSARTITGAAAIMVVVFLSFVSAGFPAVQRIGVATAVAIAVDATLVRLVLVPAAMELLGEWNWWLPRPLARVLGATTPVPTAPVEGVPFVAVRQKHTVGM